MITFLLYTIVAWVATSCLAKILHFSIQHGQWIDKLFNYQAWLLSLDMNGNSSLAKVLGNCEMCFSHLLSLFSFAAHVIFMNQVLGYWIVNGHGLFMTITLNFIWYLTYVSISSIFSLLMITKVFR